MATDALDVLSLATVEGASLRNDRNPKPRTTLY